MTVLTTVPYYRGITIDPGMRPNLLMRYTSGFFGAEAVNNRIFELEFVWPATAPGGLNAFQLIELIATASGLSDALKVDSGQRKSGDSSVLITLMEVLRGETAPLGRYYSRTPLNEEQVVHPNAAIGPIRPNLDQIFGWDYEGFESPYENPSEISRIMVVRDQAVELGIRNEAPFVVTNTTKFILNVLQVVPLNPQIPEDVAKLKGMVTGRIPKTFWSPGVGRSDIQDFEGSLKVLPWFWNGREILLASQMNPSPVLTGGTAP